MSAPDLLRRRDLSENYRISKAMTYRLLANDPSFPRPIALGPKSLFWRRKDIESWLDSKQEK